MQKNILKRMKNKEGTKRARQNSEICVKAIDLQKVLNPFFAYTKIIL